MPVPYSRRDWGFTLSSAAVPTPSAAVPYDNRPISEAQLLAIHIYVYGGLAFFIAVIISALIWYAYIICYHKKMRDLPDELHYDKDFILATQNLPRRPGFKVDAYEESADWKTAIENRKLQKRSKKAREEYAVARRKNNRDSQLDAGNRGSQRVSWASSVATLKGNRLSFAEETPGGLLRSSLIRKGKGTSRDYLPRPTSDPLPKSILVSSIGASSLKQPDGPSPGKPPSFQFSDTTSIAAVTPVPQAHTELPRTQVHVEPNANIGNEMIATTGPAEAESWSGPKCTCNAALDGMDALILKAMCGVHRFDV